MSSCTARRTRTQLLGYMRAWWDREMDRVRIVATVVGLAGICLWVVAFAAADFPLLDDAPWSALGAALGVSIGAFVNHRSRGPARGLAWAVANGAATFVLFLVMIGAAVTLRPMLRGVPELGDASWAFAAGAFGLVALSAVLWERSRAGRVAAALTWLGLGLLFAGLASLRFGQGVLGALALPTGIVLLVLGWVKGSAARQRRSLPST